MDHSKAKQSISGLPFYRRKSTTSALIAPGLEIFQSIGVLVPVPKGSRIFEQGEACSSVYVVWSGHVKLICSSNLGKEFIMRVTGPGTLLGLSAALGDVPHFAGAKAVEACVVNRIATADFIASITADRRGALFVAQQLASESHLAHRNLRRLALAGSITGRLADLLLCWVSEYAGSDGRLTMTFTHEELAAMLGTSRETVTRVMRTFERRSLIRVKGYSLYVLSTEGLTALCGS